MTTNTVRASSITMHANTYQMALSMAWMFIQSGYDVEIGQIRHPGEGIPVRAYFKED